MFRKLLSALAVVTFSCLSLFGQDATSAPATKDYSFTLSASGSWTDTGITLQPDETVQVSPATGCTGSANDNLPLSSAPAGSLIAKLAADATPIQVSSDGDIPISQAGHLFLATNGKCPASSTVTVHVAPLSQKDRLKQQAEGAAAIFLQGQFGNTVGDAAGKLFGTSTPTAATAADLKISDAPLDPRLRKDIDGLPRRVNDQFKNLGDMVNFVLIGSEADVKSTLTAANWHVADTSDVRAAFTAVDNTYQNQDYLAMPMSTLYLFGRPQDFGYEMAEPIAMVASRHHFRLWKAPFTWNGQPVWAGAGTHDIGFAKDKRNGSVTHKIDPNLDGERTNIGDSLQKTGKVQTMSYCSPANAVTGAKNATGDSYTSDGKILVMFLK